MIKFDTATSFINNHIKPSGFTSGDIISFEGFASKGDKGAARWKALGTTGAASVTPLTNNSPNLSDASGNEFVLVGEGIIDLNVLGGVGVSYQNIADAANLIYSQGLTSNPNVSDRYIDATVSGMTGRASPQVGEAYIVSDRANGIFDTVTKGATPNVDLPNGYNIIVSTADPTKCFVLRVGSSVIVEQLGVVTSLPGGTDSREGISRAIDLAIYEKCKKVEFLGDAYYISDVIFLPISLLSEGVLLIDGSGAQISGPEGDTINIFESSKSSVSWGGETNWGEAAEAFIHSNTHIINFSFINYDIALRLYNFNFNCKISGCTWRRGKTAMHAKRCFYMTFKQNNIRNAYVGKPDTEISVLFEDFSNVIYCNDNHVSNWDGTQATGIGIQSIGGANAFNLSDWAIEGCKIGLWLGGENRPFDIQSNYFEANEKSIYHDNGALSGTVSNNWFADPITYEAATGIADQLTWGKNFNVNGGTITEDSTVSSLQIIDGPQFANSSTYAADVTRPAEQALGDASKFLNDGFQIAYDPASGFAGAGGRSTIPYSDMLMPFNYLGRLFRINTPIPFVDITYSNPNLILDTQIQYLSNYLGGIAYDLTINHNDGIDYLSGQTLNNGNVTQFDAVGRTVTTSNNAGFVRFTITGFSVVTTPTVFGRIRAI